MLSSTNCVCAVRADHPSEHHVHDGAGLGLPLCLLLAPRHAGHQARGGVAPVQPRLPFHGHHQQHHAAGQHHLVRPNQP